MTSITANLAAHTQVVYARQNQTQPGTDDAAVGEAAEPSVADSWRAAVGANTENIASSKKAAEAEESDPSDPVEQAKKQIEKIKEQLQRAQEELQEATRAAAAPDDQAAQARVQAAQAQVGSLNSALQQAYSALTKALQDSGSSSSGQNVSTTA